MNKRLFLLLGALGLIAVLAGSGAWYLHTQSPQDTKQDKPLQAELHFFDIGQGDSIYIRTSTDQDVLIDGGPGNTVMQHLGRTMPLWDKQIELVVISHADADHITGLVAACDRYAFKQIVWAPQPSTSSVHQALIDCVERQQRENSAEVLTPIAGDVVTLNDYEHLRVLYPFSQDSETAANTEKNDYSIVIEYVNTQNAHDETTVLLTGDMGAEGEWAMIAAGLLEDIDVLKAGHHGSNTSTSSELLAATTPEYTVIQVGRDNKYGHPHEEIMQRLTAVMPEANILRNDTSGTIRMIVTPSGYTIAPKPVGELPGWLRGIF